MPIDFRTAFSGTPTFTTVTATTYVGALQQTDGTDIVISATTGSSLGGASSKTGMHGVKILQASRSGQLTDSSGGTSGGATVAAIAGTVGDATAATVASTANAIATLAAKVNALEAIIHNKGITA